MDAWRSLLGATMLIAQLTAYAQVGAASDAVVEAVRQQIDDLSAAQKLTIEGAPLVAAQALPILYELHGYQPFWDAARAASLIGAVRQSKEDGLTPADYHLAALERLVSTGDRTPLQAAQLDLIATDAYVVLLSHLYFGKTDPVSLDSRWNFDARKIEDRDAMQVVFDALMRPDFTGAIEAARPNHWMYKNLKDALAGIPRD